MGTAAPDYPPFDLTTSGHDYEGLTADYAGILARTLALPVRVQRFASRESAMEALEKGDIDLLGTANGFEAGCHQCNLFVQRAFSCVPEKCCRWLCGSEGLLV